MDFAIIQLVNYLGISHLQKNVHTLDIEKLESKEYGGIKYYLATYQLASDELNGAAIKSKTAITLYNGYILLFQYLTMSDMYVLDFDSFLNSICFQ